MSYLGSAAYSLVFLIASATASEAQSVEDAPVEPVRSDDVSADAAERVRSIVEASSEFSSLQRERAALFIAVETVRVKPDAAVGADAESVGQTLRRAIYYRYGDNVTVSALVDEESGKIVAVEEAKAIPTRLAEEEVIRAKKLAQSDARVRRLLGRAANDVVIEALPLFSADPDDPIFGRRAVSLFFRRGETYFANVDVIVDLTGGKVLVEDRRGRTRDGDHQEHPQ